MLYIDKGRFWERLEVLTFRSSRKCRSNSIMLGWQVKYNYNLIAPVISFILIVLLILWPSSWRIGGPALGNTPGVP